MPPSKRVKLPSSSYNSSRQSTQVPGLNMSQKSTISLMSLPPEIRLNIYSYLTDFTGIIMIFSARSLVRDINRQAISLLHVNQIIRQEMSTAFYRNQTFQFRSLSAMDGFLQGIGIYYSSLIRNIQIGAQLSTRVEFESALPTLMRWLPSVERLSVLHASKSWASIESESEIERPWHIRFMVQAGSRSKKLLKAAPRLAEGKLYYFFDKYEPELHCVPSDVVYENAKPKNKWFHYNFDTVAEVDMPSIEDDEEEEEDEPEEIAQEEGFQGEPEVIDLISSP